MRKHSNAEAWRRVKRVVRKSDVVLEVLDARMPLRSKTLELLVKKHSKKLIIIFNRADMVSDEKIRELKRKTKEPNLIFSAIKHWGTKKLKERILSTGLDIPIKVGVVGYPNTGKSSLINAMLYRKAASTSPTPNWTKGEQWLRAGKILFLDTPGVLPGGQSETYLAIANAFDPDLLKKPIDTALKIIQISNAKEVYGLKEEGEDALRELAKARGKLQKGGVPDINFAAKLVVREFQRGNLKRLEKVKNGSEEG